jgi:hypothetical protein
MLNLVVVASLFGVLLGQFFKVLILVYANVLLILFLFIVAACTYSNDDPASIALKIAAVIPSTTVGFALGQTAFHVPDLLDWLRRRRTPPASERLLLRR